MRSLKSSAVGLVAAAVAVLPLAPAGAATHPAPAFAVTKVVVSHGPFSVAKAAVHVGVAVQVRDFSRKFDPKTVTLLVTEKISGTPQAFAVAAHLIGRSAVVSNWHATITVPKAALGAGTKATFCVALVKVADGSAVTPVRTSVRGLTNRNCFVVTG